MAIAHFKETKPLFLPEAFFVGRLEGWAVVESLVGGFLSERRYRVTANWTKTPIPLCSRRRTPSMMATATRYAGPSTKWAKASTRGTKIG